MATALIQCLLDKFKTGDPAEYEPLNKLMRNLLTVKKSISDSVIVSTVKCIIASGMTFEEFTREGIDRFNSAKIFSSFITQSVTRLILLPTLYFSVKKYDTATTCGLVWIHNFIAYRCRTCAISPCMSLCADCFNKGDHIGHDFNMFKSIAGGACDCGDESVMKPSGFCVTHRVRPEATIPSPPPKLLFLANGTIPFLLNRLLWELRQIKLQGRVPYSIRTAEPRPIDIVLVVARCLPFCLLVCLYFVQAIS